MEHGPRLKARRRMDMMRRFDDRIGMEVAARFDRRLRLSMCRAAGALDVGDANGASKQAHLCQIQRRNHKADLRAAHALD